MKSAIKKIGVGFILVIILGSQLAMAQSRPPVVPGIGDTPGEDTLLLPHPAVKDIPAEQYFRGALLPTITQTIIALSGASAFLFIIVGGIQILTAYGNEEKIAAGKKTIEYAVVGLLVAILSYAIVSIVSAVQLGKSPEQQAQEQANQQAPGSEDMTSAEMNDPGAYGPGSEPIQGGVQPKS